MPSTVRGNTYESVQDYYGNELKTTKDLKTDCCTTSCAASANMPRYVKSAISMCHDEVLEKYYGCGIVAPTCLKGKRVLDLGCGAGRDVYVLAKLVGEEGLVVGVDMTDNMLNVARKHVDYHMDKFFPTKRASDPTFSNVRFYTGKIEELDQIAELEKGFFDVIVSNCVINLCTDKTAALQHAYNLLRVGGEMYFSDVYADRRCPKELLEDRVLYGECISGALYWNDFLQISKGVGFRDPRVLGKSSPFKIFNQEIIEKVKGYKFYSVLVRLWKHPEMELTQEDYGHVVTYNGGFDTITGNIGGGSGCATCDDKTKPAAFQLDADHHFECCVPTPVSGNTFLMLRTSRFASLFGFKIASTDAPCCSTEEMAKGDECCGGDAANCCEDVDVAPTLKNVTHLQRFDCAAAQARIASACCDTPCCDADSCCAEWTATWPFDDSTGEESGADGAGGVACNAGSGCC